MVQGPCSNDVPAWRVQLCYLRSQQLWSASKIKPLGCHWLHMACVGGGFNLQMAPHQAGRAFRVNGSRCGESQRGRQESEEGCAYDNLCSECVVAVEGVRLGERGGERERERERERGGDATNDVARSVGSTGTLHLHPVQFHRLDEKEEEKEEEKERS